MTAPPGTGESSLGKNSAVRDRRTLQLADYLTGPVLHDGIRLRIPPAVDPPEIATWGMLGNRARNDCVPAALIHLQQTFSWLARQHDREIAKGPAEGADKMALEEMALELYKATGEYDPEKPRTDRGVTLLHALKWWRRQSKAEREAPKGEAAPAQGQPVEQKPTLKESGLAKMSTFAAWEPGNMEQLKGTIATLGGMLLGLRMPLTAQHRRVWSVPPGGPQNWGAPGSWQGHCVTAVGYNDECVQVVTWGGLMPVTWQFIATYCDEAFAVFSDDAPLRVFDGAAVARYATQDAILLPAGPDGEQKSLAEAIYEDSEALADEAMWGTHANISH